MAHNRKAVVLAALRHQSTDYCPYAFYYESDVADRLDAYYGGSEWRRRYRNYIQWSAGADDGRSSSATTFCRDLYGARWRMDLRPFHLEEPVLREPSLRGYRFPDPDRFFPPEWEARERKNLADISDCFTVAGIGMGLFERSWCLRGFVEVLTDAAAEPAFFADLVAAIAEHQEKLLDRLLVLPIDGVLFSDDWGDQRGVIIGPERWREVIKPNYARLYAKVKSAGKFVLTHCCGSIPEIIPDVIEIGLDVLESIQPEARGMNPYDLKNRWGDRLTFWGGLGSQSIIPFGTPAELRAEIRRLAAHMRTNGGYILAGAKGLQPETPTENAAAILEEFTALGEPFS